MEVSTLDRFHISGDVVVITGGAGFLGLQHAAAVLDGDGVPVLLDINPESLERGVNELSGSRGGDTMGIVADITSQRAVQAACARILDQHGHVDALVNNAAVDPKVGGDPKSTAWSRFETFPLDTWERDIAVGLTGALICSQVFGSHMAARRKGVILNIASDLGIIAPDQRIYRKEGIPDELQEVKPVSYSVVKHGLIGLTRYCATYWADRGIRVNALCPGGMFHGQPEEFVRELTHLIPLGRMATEGEYRGAILFLLSSASSYMTGSILVMDGGRTCW